MSNWTTKLPNKEGWYWVWFDEDGHYPPEAVYVESSYGGILGIIECSEDGGEFVSLSSYVVVKTYWMLIDIPELPQERKNK